MSQTNPGYFHCLILYSMFFSIFLSILLYRWNRGWRQSRGCLHHTKPPITSEKSTPWDRRLLELKKGDTKNSNHRSFLFHPFVSSEGTTYLLPPDPPCTDHLNTAPLPPRRRPFLPPRIAIKTLNICYCQGFKLVPAIQAVEFRGFNVMLITKTNLQSEAYSHHRLGYNMTCLATRHSSAMRY